MKISKKDFDQMKAKYDDEVKKGKCGQGNKKDIDNQTNWISYTKEDLMEVLGQEGVTGIKFHFTEYPQNVAEDFFGPEADLYIGRLTLVYSPIYATSTDLRAADGNGEYYDKGDLCPPRCQ